MFFRKKKINRKCSLASSSSFLYLKFSTFIFFFTCLSPGTSVTGLPSALIHRISGRGLPVAAHSTTVPVVLEKSMRLDGSFKKTGPDRDDELAAAVAEPSPTHAPINQKKNNLLSLYGHHHHHSAIRRWERSLILFKFILFWWKKMSITGNGIHAFFVVFFFLSLQKSNNFWMFSRKINKKM